MEFEVIDNETGERPDLDQIARTEEWAQGLLVYDISGFVITQDGNLLLLDDCNNVAYCPAGRFTVVFDKEVG